MVRPAPRPPLVRRPGRRSFAALTAALGSSLPLLLTPLELNAQPNEETGRPPVTAAPLQEGTPPAGTDFTFAEALTLARRNLEDYQLNAVHLERADALSRLALASLLPQLTFQGQYTHSSYEVVSQSTGEVVLPKDNLQATGNLSAPLFNGPALPAFSAARRSEQATGARVAYQQETLDHSVARAFYMVLAADRQVEARLEAVRAAGENLRVARERQEAGVALPLAVARAQLEEAQARAALEEANIARTRARAALSFQIGREVPPGLVAPALSPVPLTSDETLLAFARNARGDLRAADLEAAAATLLVRNGWLDYLPSLSLFGTFRATPFPGFIGGVPAEPLTWQLGLRLDFTLYDGGAREVDLRLRRISQRETRLVRERLDRAIELELRQARLELASAEASLVASREAVIAARVNFEAVSAQQLAGRATPLEVADATAERTQAEVQQILGELTRDLAQLTLRQALGVGPLEPVSPGGQPPP